MLQLGLLHSKFCCSAHLEGVTLQMQPAAERQQLPSVFLR